MTRLQDEKLERMIDARVSAALRIDREFRNEENADEQSEREATIEREVQAQVMRELHPDDPEEGYTYC